MTSGKAFLGGVAALGMLLLAGSWGSAEAAAPPAKGKASTTKRPASKQGTTQATVTANSFTASGLFNEEALTALFRGDFGTIDFNRDDLKFAALFQDYLNAYAQKCYDDLPKDKVEMTVQKCDLYEVTRNGFGVEIGRVCTHYVTVGTGLYADPRLYAAMKEIDRLMAADRLRQVGRLLFGPGGPAGGAMNMANMAQASVNDMNSLVQMNPCSGPGLKRFAENLRLFALNEKPIQLEGITAPVAVALSDADYADLIKDLVADHAMTWAVNRLVSGSVTDASVSSRDPAGRPSKMVAEYTYNGFNGLTRGSVSVHFIDGVPDCIYFSDAPTTCRAPSRKITAAYTSGARAKRSPDVASAPAPGPAAPVARPVAAPAIERGAPEAKRGAPASVPERVAAAPVPPPAAVPVEPPPPPAPKRELKAVSYMQGIKDACLEVLADGHPRESETNYCFCLSAAASSIPISDADAKWLFENFSDAALGELEQRYAGLVRRFATCRAQREARSDSE